MQELRTEMALNDLVDNKDIEVSSFTDADNRDMNNNSAVKIANNSMASLNPGGHVPIKVSSRGSSRLNPGQNDASQGGNRRSNKAARQ